MLASSLLVRASPFVHSRSSFHIHKGGTIKKGGGTLSSESFPFLKKAIFESTQSFPSFSPVDNLRVRKVEKKKAKEASPTKAACSLKRRLEIEIRTFQTGSLSEGLLYISFPAFKKGPLTPKPLPCTTQQQHRRGNSLSVGMLPCIPLHYRLGQSAVALLPRERERERESEASLSDLL